MVDFVKYSYMKKVFSSLISVIRGKSFRFAKNSSSKNLINKIITLSNCFSSFILPEKSIVVIGGLQCEIDSSFIETFRLLMLC